MRARGPHEFGGWNEAKKDPSGAGWGMWFPHDFPTTWWNFCIQKNSQNKVSQCLSRLCGSSKPRLVFLGGRCHPPKKGLMADDGQGGVSLCRLKLLSTDCWRQQSWRSFQKMMQHLSGIWRFLEKRFSQRLCSSHVRRLWRIVYVQWNDM